MSVDGAIRFICMSSRHMGELLPAGPAIYSVKNVIVRLSGCQQAEDYPTRACWPGCC